MERISIVVPNYNGLVYLEVIIPKLIQTNHELIIVDNFSNDGSIEYIKKFNSKLILIENSMNNGFSKAVNQGIMNSNCDYVVLLNNDTDFELEVFDILLNAIKRDNRIFSVAPKMIQFNNERLIDTAGDEYNILGWAHKRGFNKSSKRYRKEKRIFSSCAGAAIYRKNVFREIGYFDNSFFAYLEDVDIGYRANIFGYKNYYCPDAIIYHIGSGTSGAGRNSFKTRLSGRNSMYIAYKNMPLFQLFINFPFLLIGVLIKWLVFSKYGFGSIYINGVLEGLKGLYKIDKTPYIHSNFKHYIWLQIRMVWNVFAFVYNRLI